MWGLPTDKTAESPYLEPFYSMKTMFLGVAVSKQKKRMENLR
jgi:hypothetical protein